MEVKITVRNKLVFPERAEEYLRKKLEHVEAHAPGRGTLPVEVIIAGEGHLKVCEVLMRTKGHDFFARAEAADFDGAIDEAVHKLKTQVERYFKKIIDGKRRAQ